MAVKFDFLPQERKMKEVLVGGVCNKFGHGRDDKYLQNSGWKILSERPLRITKRRSQDDTKIDYAYTHTPITVAARSKA
jgi:hypothetical protein